MGYARTRSVPSLVAGLAVGALYGFGAYRIREGGENGYEICTGASAILLAASAPRARKGPVPLGLTAISVPPLAYYGKKVSAHFLAKSRELEELIRDSHYHRCTTLGSDSHRNAFGVCHPTWCAAQA